MGVKHLPAAISWHSIKEQSEMKKKKLRLSTVLTVLFTVGFVISGTMVYKTLHEAHMEKQGFEKLAQMVAAAQAETPADPAPETESTPEEAEPQPAETRKASPYAPLKALNQDFFGWISIEGTAVNYPVMHTPENPEYYLHHDFEGGDSQSGVPFMDAACHDGCGNYLIYGHNMKNGSMFATLPSYAKRTFWEEHPAIRFDTLSDAGTYEVVAAFYSQVYEKEAENVFRYYDYTDLGKIDDFESYVAQVKAASQYDTGITPVYGDQLLTLSTCSYHTDDGRFVVVARKVVG